MAPALAACAKPVGEAAVRHALQPLVLHYGVAEAARSPAFWVPYLLLAEMPAEALKKGVREYLGAADSEYFPKVGPLKALCAKHARPIFQAAHRAEEAARLSPPPKRTGNPGAVRALFEDFSAKMKAKAETSPLRRHRPSPNFQPGKVDACGLTEEMRKLIARRNGEGA